MSQFHEASSWDSRVKPLFQNSYDFLLFALISVTQSESGAFITSIFRLHWNYIIIIIL